MSAVNVFAPEPQSPIKVPEQLRFGKSAKASFVIPAEVDFSASTPITKANLERSASFFTADEFTPVELTPVLAKMEGKTPNKRDQILHVSSPSINIEKPQTDSSYFDKMLEIVSMHLPNRWHTLRKCHPCPKSQNSSL